MTKPFQITVDGPGPYDPASGQTQVPLPTFKGKIIYPELLGSGTYDNNKWGPLANGGFELLTGTLETGGIWTIHETGFAYGSSGQSSYTNGFNLARVMSALAQRIGWRNLLPSTELPALTAPNDISKSGRYFEDFHALCTLPNVYDCIQSIQMPVTEWNLYLQGLMQSIIMKGLTSVFQEREYIEQITAYDRLNNCQEREVENIGKFVGVRINVVPDIRYAVQVDAIGLYFTEDVDFTLYLFHEAKAAPIWSGEVSAVERTQTIVELQDIILNYIGSNNSSGAFYLGYFQDDLGSAKAIYEQTIDYNRSRLFALQYVQADVTGVNNFIRNNMPMGGNTWGLNPQVSSFRDHTMQIVRKPALFDNAIGLMMAANIVQQVLYSTRLNGTKTSLAGSIENVVGANMDLTGTAPVPDLKIPNPYSLKRDIEREMIRLNKEFFPKPKGQVINYADC